MQCAQKEWSIGWTVHCFTIVNVSGISVCIHKLRWDLEWRRMPNSYEFWLQFRHEITVRFPKFLTNIFGSSVEIPDVHHELNYAVIKKIANLRTEGINFTWKFEVRKLRVSQVRRSTSKLLLKLNRYFFNGRFIDLDGNLQGQKGLQKLSAYLWHPRPQGLFPWLRTGGKRP